MNRFIKTTITVLLLAALTVGTSRADDVECAKPVNTGQGLIRGHKDADLEACVWKGVPFAAPPVGELRWRAPQPPGPHSGVFDAYEYGAACPQDQSLTSGGEVAEFSEDCLTLNIWRPKKSGKFPVMYWIHGGAFRQGSGTYEMSDGARLAAQRDVVIVTIDYRLGALGFLALPELAQEDPNNSTGNYGILDQIEGLKWVRDNIAGFGGDPDNVTIFGQSAGGMSVCILLTSPPARGLFHRAINMSGSCDTSSDLEKAFQSGDALAEGMECQGPDRLQCLRDKTADQILPESHNLALTAIAGGGLSHSPNLDGYVLVESPLESIKNDNFNKVPVMLGHTRDEVRLYTMIMPGMSLWPRSFVNYIMRRLMRSLVDDVMQLYSYSDYKHPAGLLIHVANDAFISRGFIAAEALASRTPTYYWRFDWDDTRFRSKMGAFHGLDEPLVFGALQMDSRLAKILANKKAIESGEPLSEKMMSYYTNFAKTGNPNGTGLPEWPTYSAEKKERLYFDNPITVESITGQDLERYNLFADFSMEDLAADAVKE